MNANPKRLAALIAIALGGYIYLNVNEARGDDFGNTYDLKGTDYVFEEMKGEPGPTGNQRSKQDTLQDMASGYVAGNLGRYAGTFASDANHNGDNVTDALFEYHRMFRDTEGRQLQLHDVVIADDGSVTAWVVVSGRVLCGGPVDIEFNHLGYVSDMTYGCYVDEDALAPSMDLAVTGQAADIATTGIGLLAGLSEMNPLVGAMACRSPQSPSLPLLNTRPSSKPRIAERLKMSQQLSDGARPAGTYAHWQLLRLVAVH